MKAIIKKVLTKFGINNNKLQYLLGRDILYDVGKSAYNSLRALLIYITEPFRSFVDLEHHQNFWQAKEIARILGEFGYMVDVAEYNNPYTKPKYNYDLVIGLIPRCIDIYSRQLNHGAKKIAYLTSSNLAYTNTAEEKRIEELFERRGVRLKARRNAGLIDKSIENFDAAFFIGNEYNFLSYSEFNMPPTYFIRNNGYVFNHHVDWAKKQANNFVFFGSGGQVHKGLDLLLEIFAKEKFPCNLYVCGFFEKENDFVETYKEELYNRNNIFPVGFVMPGSEKFFEIMDKCAYSILPSCAEARAGALLSTMSAGVISIASIDCGYDESDIVLLPNCKIETIEKYILEYGFKDSSWVQMNCKQAIDTIKNKYTRKNFSESIIVGLNAVLGAQENK